MLFTQLSFYGKRRMTLRQTEKLVLFSHWKEKQEWGHMPNPVKVCCEQNQSSRLKNWPRLSPQSPPGLTRELASMACKLTKEGSSTEIGCTGGNRPGRQGNVEHGDAAVWWPSNEAETPTDLGLQRRTRLKMGDSPVEPEPRSAWAMAYLDVNGCLDVRTGVL